MESCDVLIVGGGPAGSSCAWKLSQHGLDVIVIDKALFPRDKVCAGWITPAVLSALEVDPLVYGQDHVIQEISAFRTGLIRGRQLETSYPTTVSFGIRRCEFDDYLLRRSGARLRLGQPFRSIERSGAQWLVNGEITAPLVIGAGGHFCPVARHLGGKLGAGGGAVAAQEIEFEMTPAQADACPIQPDTPELYFCRDLKGYGWCVRKGRHLNIGLGREGADHLPEQIQDFRAFLKQWGKDMGGIPERFHGHAYHLYGYAARPLLNDGVLLIGDAAGLAYPQSGEGIRPAVESGLMAAAIVLDAKQDYRSQRLQAYRQLLVARFGAAKGPTTDFVPSALRNIVAGPLLGNRWFTRHVLLDRWFLHTQQGQPQLTF